MHSTAESELTKEKSLLRYLVIALSIALLLLLWPMPEMSRFFRYGMDLLHAPFFAVFAFILDQKRRRLQNERFYKLFFFWLLLLILAMCLEAAQSWVGRDSNWHDGLSNILGITAGIFFSFSCSTQRFYSKWITRLLGILLIISGSLYGFRGMLDTLQAQVDFPVFADFESNHELLRWQIRDASLVQSRQHATSGNFSGKLVLRAGRYPGVSIELPVNDWSTYKHLKFDVVWSPQNESSPVIESRTHRLALRIKLEDREPSEFISDRFESTIELHPGKNYIQIPLVEIANGPENRLLRLNAMSKLSLFVPNLKTTESLFVDRIFLD